MRLRHPFERAAAVRFLRLPPRLLRAIVGAPVRSPDGFVLDLQSQALLWLHRATHEPDMRDPQLAIARRRLERAGTLLAPRAVSPLGVRDRTLPGGAGPRRVRVYSPPASRRGLLPGLVWLHGGGYVLGSIESHDGVCRALASQAGIVVASMDYRLAPEHKFPAGLEDAIAITRWVLEQGETIGVDQRAVAVGGDSAGANLAAGTALACRGARRQPAFQLLVYPATDATRAEASHQHFRDGFFLTAAEIQWYLDRYLPDPSLATDPRVSPLFEPELSGLPPALVLTAGFDPLRDEGRLYATRMRAAGVDVESLCAEGSLHGFMNTAGALDESARLLAYAADRVRRSLFARVYRPTA